MNLLIADDELIIRKGLASLDWESVGIDRVFLACDGKEAKQLLLKENIDIIISDIRMPGLNGVELSEYVRQEGMDTAILFLTGFSEFDYALAAIKNEVCEYLLKPVKPQELLATIKRVREKQEAKRYQQQILVQHGLETEEKDLTQQMKELFPDVRPEVEEALRLIMDGNETELSLNMLAGKFHFSSTYVSKIIKKETGYSYSVLVIAIRLYRSIELLKQGKMKIQEISEQSGFVNQHYYSGIFKRTFGFSPNHYKKQERQEYSLKDVLDLLEKQA